MRVLVTGSAGFIGNHLTRRLTREGHVVLGYDIADDISSDIRKPIALAPLGRGVFSHCVHLAAIAAPRACAADPVNAWATNVLGTYNVLHMCRAIGIRRVVFASSAHVLGISPRYMPTDEFHPLALGDAYTASKVLAEKTLEAFDINHGVPYCALRFFNIFGPGQNEDYFLGAKLKQAKDGDLTIRGPEITKDWLWVDDAVDAIVRALQSDFVGPLNIGTGVETSLGYLANKIASAFGREVKFELTDDPGPTRMCADWGRAKRTLGWEPRVGVDEGLARLIEAEKAKVAA